jgi:hypothetical protein
MTQITTTPIRYNTVAYHFGATIKYEVGVMDSASGLWFNFGDNDDDIWIFEGNKISFLKLVNKIGTSAMDDHFFFVWLNFIGEE